MSDDTATTKSGNRGLKIAAVVICAPIVLIVAVILIGSAFSDDNSAAESAGLVACHDAVAAQFRNPATVDFHTTSQTSTEAANGGWVMTGTLNADTDLGVAQEFSYRCEVDSTGSVTDSRAVRVG